MVLVISGLYLEGLPVGFFAACGGFFAVGAALPLALGLRGFTAVLALVSGMTLIPDEIEYCQCIRFAFISPV
jgi:hypothetical protein